MTDNVTRLMSGTCLRCGREAELLPTGRVAPHSPPGLQSARCAGGTMPPLSGDDALDGVRREALEQHSATVSVRERIEEEMQGLSYVAALDYRASDIARQEYLAELWAAVITAGDYWAGVQQAFTILLARNTHSSDMGRVLNDAYQQAARAFLRGVRHRFLGELSDTGRKSDTLLAHLWFNV